MYLSPEMLAKCHAASGCHMCKGTNLRLVLDLGSQPHSDDFLEEQRLSDIEFLYPLRLVSCADCGLLQIDYFVDPEILYRVNYVYESSTTKTGTAHYRDMAAGIAKHLSNPQGKLAVDIGSNVGVLLQGFKDEGFAVLGVDPAQHAARTANANGIETINDFFTVETARMIREQKGTAAVITGTNVFAHIHSLDSATDGMRELLASDGVIVIEAPSAMEMIDKVEYDTIYHQHIGYLSALPMKRYFEAHGLELYDVELQEIHGGTLRYFVQHPGARTISARVDKQIAGEIAAGLYDIERLKGFGKDAKAQRIELLTLLTDLKRAGKRIIGISAPAKGNTLLNFCHIDTTYLDYVTERNILKVGKYTPGTHIPILNDSILDTDSPDYALLLAWNFAPEIMANLKCFSEKGGKFIIPIPRVTIV